MTHSLAARFSLVLCAGLFVPVDVSLAQAPARKPNIVVILADDLGYADVSVQGCKDVPTPNIDSIARAGVRFTSGYVSGPYCSPTRAGFLTGRYQQRFGHEFNPGGPGAANNDVVGLSLKEVTLANRLKGAGYATALVGKWHEGFADKFHPLNRGFDEYFGFLGGAHSYTNLSPSAPDPIRRGFEPVEEKEYLTDAFTREAVSFIDRKRNTPFFLYLAYNADHSPMDAHPEYFERFASITDLRRRQFAAMHTALDEGVGSVLRKLRESGLEENTLVVFFSDNGGPTANNSSRNDPLRGFKSQTWEGGIRVPFMMQWKGTLPAGKVYDYPIIQLDLYPTALGAAGVELKSDWKLDGVNLIPYLNGSNPQPPHAALYWRFGGQIAVRQGDWKLVKAAGGDAGATTATANADTQGAELYNLAQDIGERNNLVAKEPAKVNELAAAWNRWNSGLIEASWRPAPAAGNRGGRGGRGVASNASKDGPWKSGDVLNQADAPQIAGKAFAVSAEIEPAAANGVIVAHGAGTRGYAFYVEDGRLAFAVRSQGELTAIRAKDALGRGRAKVEAQLAADGRIKLLVDGQTVGEGKVAGLIPMQPGDGFSVGQDANGAVGSYAAPNPFTGKIENVRVRFR